LEGRINLGAPRSTRAFELPRTGTGAAGRAGRAEARASTKAEIASTNPNVDAWATSSAKSGSTRLPAATNTAKTNNKPGCRAIGK
jgi:hypothetical protein